MAFEVTTHSKVITPSITVDTAAYAANDCIGGKITLTGAVRKKGGSVSLHSIRVRDSSNTKPALFIVLFNSNPTAATLTDNAAAVFSTDETKVTQVITVYPTDYVSVGGVSIASFPLGSLIVQEAGASTSLYMAVISVGVTDFVAATDLGIKVGLVQD